MILDVVAVQPLRAALRAAAVLLLTALCLACVPDRAGASTPSLAPGAAPYGLVAFAGNLVPGTTPAERTANYQRLYDAGVRAVRMDLRWAQLQPPGQGGRFDFSATDREVGAIRAAGLKVIGILAYGNPDYSTLGRAAAASPINGGVPPFGVGNADFFPPDDPRAFARYARVTAQHYAGDMVAWEVWNEENEGYRFWPPREDPSAYARLLCATYPEVKAATPNLPVLFGGVFFPGAAGAPGMSGPDFVRAAYGANPNLGHCYDALAYHPYAYPFTAPELEVPVRGSVLSAADQLRAILANYHDQDKPLWITEVGWPTHLGYGVSETKQAQYVARMQAATFSQGITTLTWYTYGDGEDPTGPVNQESRFGFFRPDNTPKPAYQALKTFGSVFAGARFLADRSRELGLPPGSLNTGGRGFALQYRSPRDTITALWLASESAAEGQSTLPDSGTLGPSSASVTLPVGSAAVTVIDYLGSARTVAARDGQVTLTLRPGPQYVVDQSAGSTAGGGITLPHARVCASRRSLTIHLRRRHRTLRHLRVFINGHRVRAVRRGPAGTLIDLRGLPAGTVHVRVTARLGRGRHARRVVAARTYRTCHLRTRRRDHRRRHRRRLRP